MLTDDTPLEHGDLKRELNLVQAKLQNGTEVMAAACCQSHVWVKYPSKAAVYHFGKNKVVFDDKKGKKGKTDPTGTSSGSHRCLSPPIIAASNATDA